MILQIDVPKRLLIHSSEPEELFNAWVWMVIQKTVLLPEWHVCERKDQKYVRNSDKNWCLRCVVTVEEGKPSGRSFFASDNPPAIVRFFCLCEKCEPTILSEVPK
jgi:hypothetical protein